MFKLAFAFKHTADRSAGWTENFFVDVDTAPAAEVTARELHPLLMGLHGDQSYCTKIRVTDPDGIKPGTLVRFGKQKVKTIKEDSCSDFPTNAMTLELKGADGRTSRQWIKGIREDAIAHGGFLANEGDLAGAFTKFQNYVQLAANKIVMRLTTLPPQGDDIINLTTGGIVHSPAHGLVDKTYVKITGVQTPKYANRVWKAIPVDVDTFQLYKYRTQVEFVTNGPGFWAVDEHSPIEIKTAELIYASKRDVGRPSDVLGGHRTKK